MDTSSALISSLVEFYSAAQIRGFWKDAADALMSRSTVLIHINSTGFAGSSSGGMALSTPEEIGSFIGACKAALNQIEGTTTVDPTTLGTGVDYSRRTLQV